MPAFANRLLSERVLASQVRISAPPLKSCNQAKVSSCYLLPAHHFALDYSSLRALMEWLTGFGTGCRFKMGRKCLALPRVFNCKPAHSVANNTHNRLAGRHKAHFYNMRG